MSLDEFIAIEKTKGHQVGSIRDAHHADEKETHFELMTQAQRGHALEHLIQVLPLMGDNEKRQAQPWTSY